MNRHRAREIALQILYSLDVHPDLDPDRAVALYFDHLLRDPGEVADDPGPHDRALVESLVREVTAHREQLDRTLAEVSRNWRPERLARVDRSILRIGLWELLHAPDIPARVAIDEAIELAKRFGADDSPAFVNGMLDSAHKRRLAGS
jgi:N utilization substance protein B